MGTLDSGTVAVYIGGLDATMARSVQAFLEARHREHFALSGRAEAAVLLVDLDQPHAGDELAAATSSQVVLGVGFAAASPSPRCRHYIQKPLNGSSLVDGLSDAVAALRPAGASPMRTYEQRPSHARDIFTKGQSWQPRPPAAAAGTPTVPRQRPVATLERPDVVRPTAARGLRIVDLVEEEGSAGGAAEALGRRIEVEPVEARSAGDLRDPAVLASYRYDPAEHLDGLLRAQALGHPSDPWVVEGVLHALVGDPASRTVLVCGPESRLRGAAAAPTAGTWSTRRSRPLPDPAEATRVPLEVLLWNVAVWASAGRLALPIDPFALVAVRHWPDVPRLAMPPGLLPTVARLAQRPARPAELPEQLELPRSHVFTVLSALAATDLLIRLDPVGPAAPGRHADPPASTDAPRGVLGRLLGRLRDR